MTFLPGTSRNRFTSFHRNTSELKQQAQQWSIWSHGRLLPLVTLPCLISSWQEPLQSCISICKVQQTQWFFSNVDRISSKSAIVFCFVYKFLTFFDKWIRTAVWGLGIVLYHIVSSYCRNACFGWVKWRSRTTAPCDPGRDQVTTTRRCGHLQAAWSPTVVSGCRCQHTCYYCASYASLRYMGMGQNLLVSILMGWTSIYQLFCGSLGTRVLTHPHIEIHWDMIDWIILDQHLQISEVSECGCVTFRPRQAVQHGAKENEKATFHVPYLKGWMIIQLWSKRGYTSSSSARTFARGQSQSVTTTPWGLPGGNAMILDVFGSVPDDAWWFPQTVQVTSRKLLRSWVLLSTPLSNCRISLCAGSQSLWLRLSLALRPQKMEYCAIWKKKSLHSHPVQMCPRVFLALLCWCALMFRPGKSEAYSSSSWTVCWRLLQQIVGNHCMPSISSLWGFWYFQRVLWKCSSEWCPFWGEIQSEVGSLSPKLHPLTFASHAALIRF